MAGLDDASGISRRRTEIVGEEFTQASGDEEAIAEGIGQEAGAIEIGRLLRRLVERQAGLEEVHVRVLTPRAGQGAAYGVQAFGIAAGRMGEGVDEIEGPAGGADRLGIAGGAVIPGQREDDEGLIVEVAPVVERQALPRHPVAPAAVAMGVMPSQEAESLLRRRQRAVERIEQRRLAEGVDLAGLHHDPLAVVAGWAPRKIERLMEAAGRSAAHTSEL